jgi:hypothetical protein
MVLTQSRMMIIAGGVVLLMVLAFVAGFVCARLM